MAGEPQDDNGGIVASIVAAKTMVESGVKLAGEIWVCPVAGHKSGALGTKELLKAGWKPDFCINTKNTGNGLATTSVGAVKCDIKVRGVPVHFGMRAKLSYEHGIQSTESRLWPILWVEAWLSQVRIVGSHLDHIHCSRVIQL